MKLQRQRPLRCRRIATDELQCSPRPTDATGVRTTSSRQVFGLCDFVCQRKLLFILKHVRVRIAHQGGSKTRFSQISLRCIAKNTCQPFKKAHAKYQIFGLTARGGAFQLKFECFLALFWPILTTKRPIDGKL